MAQERIGVNMPDQTGYHSFKFFSGAQDAHTLRNSKVATKQKAVGKKL